MNTRLLIPSVLFVVILIGVGVWVGSKLGEQDPSGPSPYSAVYLATGDIYFGKLDWFPWPHLKGVLLLQRGVDGQNQQVQFGVVPLTSAFWGPVSELYLNPKQVIFWTRLRNDSQLICALANSGNPEKCHSLTPQPQQPSLPQGGLPPIREGVSGTPQLPEGLPNGR